MFADQVGACANCGVELKSSLEGFKTPDGRIVCKPCFFKLAMSK